MPVCSALKAEKSAEITATLKEKFVIKRTRNTSDCVIKSPVITVAIACGCSRRYLSKSDSEEWSPIVAATREHSPKASFEGVDSSDRRVLTSRRLGTEKRAQFRRYFWRLRIGTCTQARSSAAGRLLGDPATAFDVAAYVCCAFRCVLRSWREPTTTSRKVPKCKGPEVCSGSYSLFFSPLVRMSDARITNSLNMDRSIRV